MSFLTEKSLITKKVSRCLYCNSTSYGKGCKYAPQGVHFHPDDPKKCSYCGSPSYGKGCQLNPTGNIHLHGINYNTMFNETIQKALHNQFLLRELNKSFEEFDAYKNGIIDSDGNKMKEPVTEQERSSYSPIVKTILKVKKYLGSKLELINQTAIMESETKLKYNKENHLAVLKYEEKINDIIGQLHEVTSNALSEGLTVEQVEAMLQ
jgi:hypothetical protein